MKYTKYPELKSELKELAKKIKAAKVRRDNFWEYKHELADNYQNSAQSVFMCRAVRLSNEFRHKHIAYCLLRGRSYEQIEQPRDNNKPDMIYVQMIMEEYGQQKTEFRTIQHQE